MKFFKKNNHSDHALVMPLSTPYTLLVFLFLASAFLIVLTPQNAKAQNLKNQIETQRTVEYTPEENNKYCTGREYIVGKAVHSTKMTPEERNTIFSRCRRYLNYSPDPYPSPLMSAIVLGKLEIVKELLLHNAYPRVAAASGWSGLHEAITKNNYEMVRVLLMYGADYCYPTPNIESQKSPYELAQESTDYRIARLLKRVTRSDEGCRQPKLESKHPGNGFRPSKELTGTYAVTVYLGYGYQHEFRLKIHPNGSMTYSEEQPPPGVKYGFTACEGGLVTLKNKTLEWKGSQCSVGNYFGIDLKIYFYSVRGELNVFETAIASNHIFHVDFKGQAILPTEGRHYPGIRALFRKVTP